MNMKTFFTRAWNGAAVAVMAGAILIALVSAWYSFRVGGWRELTIGSLAFLMIGLLVGALVPLGLRLLNRLPAAYLWALACLFGGSMVHVMTTNAANGVLVVVFGMAVALSLTGAGLAAKRRVIGMIGLTLGIALLIAGAIYLHVEGFSEPAFDEARWQPSDFAAPLTLPNPSQPGTFAVKTLCYGSGTDRHRLEYGRDAAIRTQPVDGSALVQSWSGLRTKFWGFGPDKMPLNARVWYPDGEGAFPLALIVHGDARMEAFSDTGYAYLGELLASHGIIAVSVDENFLNYSVFADLLFFNALIEENDARGWLLLEHLRNWREWNQTPGNLFYQKTDMERIALIGHSRGGQAVSIAAAFNRLPCNPDHCQMRFNYQFGIRSIIAIAPVDWQYLPTGKPVPLENLNYLTLQGSHDMDVTSFAGARQYDRVAFTDGNFWLKSAVYIANANHGQFNSAWGRRSDQREPVNALYDLKQLLPASKQQQIASVYISAFLEETLLERDEYRPLFRDARAGAEWLPRTAYLTQYADSAMQPLANYDEDIDAQTATLPGGMLTAEGLADWHETRVALKDDERETNAVVLGWDTAAPPASYTLTLPERGCRATLKSALMFALAAANEQTEPVDWTVSVADKAGNIASLPISRYAPLFPQIQAQLTKARFMSALPLSEPIFQTYTFPFDAFIARNPLFDPTQLAQVCFTFDRTPAGEILLDDVAIGQP